VASSASSAPDAGGHGVGPAVTFKLARDVLMKQSTPPAANLRVAKDRLRVARVTWIFGRRSSDSARGGRCFNRSSARVKALPLTPTA
jgi:hypothetical protein